MIRFCCRISPCGFQIESSGEVALILQHDTFFTMLTPRETINLAAFLQLNLDQNEREELVNNILDSLGLREVESNKIGDHISGQAGSSTTSAGGCLSGGERRRLSAGKFLIGLIQNTSGFKVPQPSLFLEALELVSDPQLILADEPTSGLDSAQSLKVFSIISNAARKRNIPCICTIHQPRASIWKMLDSFILMAPGGKVIYMGSRTDGIRYFSKLGYKCPPETTPAEFFIDLVTIDSEDKAKKKVDQERINNLADAFRLHQNTMSGADDEVWSVVTKRQNGRLVQDRHLRIAALLKRSLRQNFRDSKVNVLRGTTSLLLAKLFSELFGRVKKGESLAKGVADRPALLSFSVINMTMMSMMKTINLFGKEKSVVIREQTRRHYTSFDYLVSKSIAEIPLDIFFSASFAAALKYFTGLRTTFRR